MRAYSVGPIQIAVLSIGVCYGQGTITTFGGTLYSSCSMANGVAATTACMSPGGIVFDKQGNLYFADGRSYQIRKITPQGIISTLGGTTFGYSGDGGPATAAKFTLSGGSPALTGVALDAAGNLYISDYGNNVIRMISASTGIVTTVAGTGTRGSLGDNGLAIKAQLSAPAGIALDTAGNLYVADNLNNRVRKVDSTGTITTFAGNGDSLYEGDGGPAKSTAVVAPEGLAFDSAGNLYISEGGRIRRVDTSGMISTIAGAATRQTTNGFSGDGGPATSATFAGLLGMAIDSSGNIYVADANNERIRKINTGGIISTIAGVPGNSSTPLGDNGPSTSAYLGMTRDVALDPSGNLFIAASPGTYDNLRKIAPGAGLSADHTVLPFSLSVGGAAPGSQTVQITSTGAALTFTASASTRSGGNWLSVTPTSGTTPAAITVSINPAGLLGGTTYQGTITLTPAGAGTSPLSLPVTVTVSGAGAPAITPGGIVNASGYQATLAPDTVFVIFGSALGPATLTAGSGPNYPTSLGGTSISFTPSSGGAAISAKIVYTVAGQIAGLLPSSASPGVFGVQVTYNGQTSAPQNVTVAARSFGIATANSAGSGTAQATIGNINAGLSLTRFTPGSVAFGGYNWTLSPAHPGDTVVLWGTGGGADPANDTGGSSGDQTAAGNFVVSVGGTAITPLYAGAAAGFPGLWQINFVLPTTIPPNCFTPTQVSAGGQLGNTVTLPIAAAGQTSCTAAGFSQSTLANLDSGTNVNFSGMTIGKLTSYTNGTPTQIDLFGGPFSRFSTAEWLLEFSGPSVGPCNVLDETYANGSKELTAPDAYLDAGPSIAISGSGVPANASIVPVSTPSGPVYANKPAGAALTAGSTYTLSGTGGAQIGAFTVTGTIPTSFAISNLSALATVNRTQPLTVNWTGAGFDQVIIRLQSNVTTFTTTHGIDVTCAVPANSGSYTIPSAALAYLLPGSGQLSFTTATNNGGIVVAEAASGLNANIPLVGGGQIDFGGFAAFLSIVQSATIQ